MTTIIDITDILVSKKNAHGLNENQENAVKYVGLANCSAKAATQYPQGRENYLRNCRSHLEKALIYLNEELDGEQSDS